MTIALGKSIIKCLEGARRTEKLKLFNELDDRIKLITALTHEVGADLIGQITEVCKFLSTYESPTCLEELEFCHDFMLDLAYDETFLDKQIFAWRYQLKKVSAKLCQELTEFYASVDHDGNPANNALVQALPVISTFYCSLFSLRCLLITKLKIVHEPHLDGVSLKLFPKIA